MTSTVPLARPDAIRGFARVSGVYFPPSPRSRDLPMALELENGRILCVKLSITQLADLLSQLSRMGIRAPE